MRAKRPIYSDTYARRHRLMLTLIAVFGVIAIVLGGWWWSQRNPRPNPQKYPVMGVRVDQTSGVIDSAALAAGGVDFVYLKATQGASFVDDDFATNYSRVGTMPVGVYHYFSFDSTPQAQVANFKRHVQANLGTLPVGVYLSAYGPYADKLPADTAKRVQAFVTGLQRAYHCSVVLMGDAEVLTTVKKVAGDSLRWQISRKAPKTGQFWEYADAKLPEGQSQQAYQSAVFIGNKAGFDQLQTSR